MSNNIEIIMNIDTLEVFEVIDLDEQDSSDTVTEENKECLESSTSTFSEKPDYHSPSCILWEVKEGKVIHTLSYRNKHGSYPYHSREPGHWGHVSQLTPEEALWKTLELNPELMNYV